ncbi:hypothetical protein F2Q68_00020636 [Brassica cretica]|uniref:Uncharacterized protein n=1 Tax=Brassica cretica TaxID=69181 RepID=A0A8S9G3Y7_BRACR|nr:hypothetical protein F2Q68_00020636 [Brassica cretica]
MVGVRRLSPGVDQNRNKMKFGKGRGSGQDLLGDGPMVGKVSIDIPMGVSIDTPFAPSIDYSSVISIDALKSSFMRWLNECLLSLLDQLSPCS